MDIRKWLPNIVTLALAALLIITQQVWASPLVARLTSTTTASSKTTINYQGYLTDAGGTPVNDTLNMVFRLYRNESDLVADAIWTETQNEVVIRNGLSVIENPDGRINGLETTTGPLIREIRVLNDAQAGTPSR